MAVAAIPGWGAGSSARASSDSIALNGTYSAISDGALAQTNYSYRNEATVTSIWTITSTCDDPMDCAGRVTSDQGWSANVRLVGGNMWFVARNVEGWERCEDGTTAPGHQTFKFSADEKLSGWDYTVGPSGACGANKWLVVEMPFKLVKTG
ncbi:hypothetical protein ACTXG5_11005 [Mycobacterium sp. Dal123C01]|uniref:hypothetical protein n=1 Tax=Mycobacterium sp. Dal123C01 TaxID=3457577 RepID=UPI00403E81B7